MNCYTRKILNMLVKSTGRLEWKKHKALHSNIHMYIHSSMGKIPVSTCNTNA